MWFGNKPPVAQADNTFNNYFSKEKKSTPKLKDSVYSASNKTKGVSVKECMHTVNEQMNNQDFRPKLFDQVIGQSETKEYLKIMIASFKKTGKSLAHTLFLGFSGVGKTTLANVVANEMGVTFHQVMATRIKNDEDLYNVIKDIEENDVVFIDEIHALSEKVQEQLYSIMEDFTCTMHDKNLNRLRPYRLPRFTLIGATTHSGELNAPLLSRFGYKAYLQPYSIEDLTQMIITAGDRIHNIEIPENVAKKLAQLSRRTARIAYNLLNSLIVIAEAQTSGKLKSEMLTNKLVIDMLKFEKIDPLIGLDLPSRRYLVELIREGRPVGSRTLSNYIGEQESTVTSMIEPFLFSEIELQYMENGELVKEIGPFVRITGKGRLPLDIAKNYILMCQNLQKSGWFKNESLNFKSE